MARCAPISGTPRAAARRGAGGSRATSVPRQSSRIARGIRSGPMHADADAWIGAVVAIGISVVAVALLRFAFARLHVDLAPQAETRLRLVERLVYAVVLGLGIAIALSKFDAVRSVSRALLASGAIAAAVVGFAARQTLANLIAGVMLAITQPLRLGDRIAFEDMTGVVEDVTLSYTFLRRFSGERIAIPNEML